MTPGSPGSIATLKISLLQQIGHIDRQQALLPVTHPDIDRTIEQLESLSPIQEPLEAVHRHLLMGSWQLIYASRGTVVTRRLQRADHPANAPLKQVWQHLDTDAETITTENGAILDVLGLGEIKLLARGVWQPTDLQTATVSFNQFVFQLRLGTELPGLPVAVPGFLRRKAAWTTSYLDETLRFGRGATGNLFVFQRCKPPAESLGT